MSREVRMVPPNWQHPKDERGYIGMFSWRSYKVDLEEWEKNQEEWKRNPKANTTFEEYYGEKPDSKHYMTEFPSGTATYFMMYETTSEGTPISPAFATQEELAQWLVDNNASAFGDIGASYDSWLKMIQAGSSIASMVVVGNNIVSGVDAVSKLKN